MRSNLSRLWRCERGSTVVEYGLIVLIMSGAIIASLPALRDAVQALYLIVSASVPGS